MDRLISGDAGYGKTEVALRAAFRTVVSGKQVAVMVPHYGTGPTTLQKLRTPVESRFGIRVEILDRYRTDVQRNKL